MTNNVESFLQYYKSLSKPFYAVLVAGAWGSGKTYQVNRCFSEGEYIYVSLFGLQTVAEVHAAVLAQVAPKSNRASKILSNIGELLSGAGGLIALGKLVPDIAIAALKQEVTNERTFIFDDLERCKVPIKDLLGTINYYVEQRRCRVVVVADEAKILDNSDYEVIKEKIFGHALRVEPNVHEASTAFYSELSDSPALQDMHAYRERVENIFKASETKSLRILRHTIHDLKRLLDSLEPLHLVHKEAIRELIEFFVVMDIEFRNGNITEANLYNRMHTIIEVKGSDVKSPVADVINRYPAFDFSNQILSDNALERLLVRGEYNPDVITSCLNNSRHFLKAEQIAPWKVVWQFDSIDDEVVEKARLRMLKQFNEREVDNLGELLHIMSLMLMMINNNILKGSVADCCASCIEYLDHLYKANKLQPAEIVYPFDDPFQYTAYDGFQFFSDGVEMEFKKIVAHLKSLRQQALENTFPEIARQMLELARVDSLQFYENVSFTNNGENPYVYVPILAHINPEEFVDAWLANEPSNWKYIKFALEGRYKSRQLENLLKDEKNWVAAVIESLRTKCNPVRDFRTKRISRIIPNVDVQLPFS